MKQYIDKAGKRGLRRITMTKEEAIKYLQQLYPNGGHCWLDEQRIEAIGMAVKALQEEPKSIWHDANKQPTMYRKYLVRYSDGRVSGSWERHDNGFIPWEDVIKEHGFTHWCYVEDLIKL
jgi:hypothetical protein